MEWLSLEKPSEPTDPTSPQNPAGEFQPLREWGPHPCPGKGWKSFQEGIVPNIQPNLPWCHTQDRIPAENSWEFEIFQENAVSESGMSWERDSCGKTSSGKARGEKFLLELSHPGMVWVGRDPKSNPIPGICRIWDLLPGLTCWERDRDKSRGSGGLFPPHIPKKPHPQGWNSSSPSLFPPQQFHKSMGWIGAALAPKAIPGSARDFIPFSSF